LKITPTLPASSELTAATMSVSFLQAYDAELRKCFQSLIKSNIVDVNARTSNGETALFLACSCSSASPYQKFIVQALLENGADPNIPSNDGYTPIYMAVLLNHWDIMHLLMSNKANPAPSKDDGMVSPLLAVMYRVGLAGADFQGYWIRLFLDKGSNTRERDSAGNTLLHMAVQCKRGDDIVKELVKRDPGLVNLSNERGLTPLFYSCSEEIMAFLLENGASLHSGDISVFDYLVQSISCADKDSSPPDSADHETSALVNPVLSSRVAKPGLGKLVIPQIPSFVTTISLTRANTAMLAWVRSQLPSLLKSSSALTKTSFLHWSQVEGLMPSKIGKSDSGTKSNPNFFPFGDTGMGFGSSPPAVSKEDESNVVPPVAVPEAKTPEVTAATEPVENSVNNLETKNMFGDTPLIVALKSQSEKVFQYLLANGADPNQRGANQLHPFSVASSPEFPSLTFIDELLKTKTMEYTDIDQNKNNVCHLILLHTIFAHKLTAYTDGGRLKTEAPTLLKERNAAGLTPVLAACHNLYTSAKLVQLLQNIIDWPFDVNEQTPEGNTILHYLFYTPELTQQLTQDLLAKGAKTDIPNEQGLTIKQLDIIGRFEPKAHPIK